MLDAVLFEFDGVLADTRQRRKEALAGALGAHGIVLSDAEYEGRCAGLPVRGAVDAAVALRDLVLDDTGRDLLAAGAERRFRSWLAKGIALADGAAELVRELSGRVRLGIVTRASRRDVEFTLGLAALDGAFECIVCAEDAYPHKPDPAPYHVALHRLGRRKAVAAGAVVALEDGVAGLRAARSAGLRCLAVGSMAAYEAIEADGFLPSLSEQSLATLEDALGSGARPR
jgi:putative hydrolase of the HAD superfamily